MKKQRVNSISKGMVLISMITLAIAAVLITSAQVSGAQEDPIGRLLKEGLEPPSGFPGTPKAPQTAPGDLSNGKKVIPACDNGWDCVYAKRIVKGSYKKANVHINVTAMTVDRDYDRISLRQTIGETHGVIINTIKVGRDGSWKTYNQGIRLPEGRTAFDIPVPAGTPEIVLSLDHGQGARLRVVLERRLP